MPVGQTNNCTMPSVQLQVPSGLAIGTPKEDDTQRVKMLAHRLQTVTALVARPRQAAPPRGNASPAVTGQPGAPPLGAPSQSPHTRPGQIPPGAPPVSIPGTDGSRTLPPAGSDNHATPVGGYPPAADMYAAQRQQHGGYPGPPPQLYADFGHEGAPSTQVNQSPWGAPPASLQHGGQYPRR